MADKETMPDTTPDTLTVAPTIIQVLPPAPPEQASPTPDLNKTVERGRFLLEDGVTLVDCDGQLLKK